MKRCVDSTTRRAATGLFGAMLLAAPAPAALNVTLVKLVEAPATTEFGRQLSVPYLSGGALHYSRTIRTETAAQWGIYRDGAQITSWEGMISGAAANNHFVADASSSNVVIGAFSNHGLSVNSFKNILSISAGGAPSRILSHASALPGYPAPHPGNPITGRASIEGTQVAFMINPYQFSTPPLKGAVALTNTGGSPVTLIAQEGDAVPNSGGVFSAFDLTTRPWLHGGGRILFVGIGSLRRGLYEWNGGALTVVVDSSMARPEGGSFNSGFVASSAVAADGSYVFATGSSGNALYRKTGSQFTLIANTSTAVPGGTGNFFSFGTPSIRNGRIVCVASRVNQFSPPKEIGIYTDFAGTFDPIVDMRTDFTSYGFGGKTVDGYEIAPGRAWASDNSIHFLVSFTDKTEAIFRATFTPAAASLPATTVFNGPRSGTITVPTRTGFNYLLRRSEDLATWSAALSTTPGTGNPIAIPFSQPNTSILRQFFRIEEVQP